MKSYILRAATKKASAKNRKSSAIPSHIRSVSHSKRSSSLVARDSAFSFKNTVKALCIVPGLSVGGVMADEIKRILSDSMRQSYSFSCRANLMEACFQLLVNLGHPNITALPDDSGVTPAGAIIGNLNCPRHEATIQQFDFAALNEMGRFLNATLEESQSHCLIGDGSAPIALMLAITALYFMIAGCMRYYEKRNQDYTGIPTADSAVPSNAGESTGSGGVDAENGDVGANTEHAFAYDLEDDVGCCGFRK